MLQSPISKVHTALLGTCISPDSGSWTLWLRISSSQDLTGTPREQSWCEWAESGLLAENPPSQSGRGAPLRRTHRSNESGAEWEQHTSGLCLSRRQQTALLQGFTAAQTLYSWEEAGGGANVQHTPPILERFNDVRCAIFHNKTLLLHVTRMSDLCKLTTSY